MGSATIKQLVDEGRQVVATDLDTPATRNAAASIPTGVEMRYTNLTDTDAVAELLDTVAPAAIIHLAAIIPPLIYTRRELARRVNVGGTAALLAAAERQSTPPRFIQASSVAVYGARNPHRISDVLTAETPLRPADVYGEHKIAAENVVRRAKLDWAILRLGGVVSTDPTAQTSLDNMYLERLLPEDGRVQTVDVRDVASAFTKATTVDEAVGQTLLIGGDDETHRLLQGAVGSSLAAAMGLVNGLPTGLRGDPNSDTSWFNTDWMDTVRSQQVLQFQRHSWPDMLAEIAENAGWKRGLLRFFAPLSREAAQTSLGLLPQWTTVRRPVGRRPRQVGRPRA